MDQEQIVDALRDWLDSDDWHYEYDAERHLIKAGITLDCKLRNARIFIPIRDDGTYIVNIYSPVNGDPASLDELIKYVAMANYGLANGNFDIDRRPRHGLFRRRNGDQEGRGAEIGRFLTNSFGSHAK